MLFLYKQIDYLPRITNSIPVVRHCKAVSQPEVNAPISSKNVIIPQRIERGPTDILKALASTVKEDFTAFEYKYPDDPFFYSHLPFFKKVLGLSLESGRKSAKWIVENNPAFFNHQLAEPSIKAFLPKTVDNTKLQLTEEILINTIEQRDTLEAIRIFKALQMKNLEISEHTKQCLLELVCFYNSESKPKEELGSKWFMDKDLYVEKMNTWNKEFAEELFDKMDPSCSLANSAIIQGMFKYNEIFKASELFEKARVNKIKLSVGAYNAYLSNSHVFAERERITVFLKKVLQEMSQKNVMPNLGTLNATLESLKKSNNFQDKPKVAMQILGEFENLGIKPSLGSYGIFFSIVGNSNDQKAYYFSIVKNIMDIIKNKEHEVLHPSDLNFFSNSIAAFYEQKSDLVMTLHEMLLKNNNAKFISNYSDQNFYYQKLYLYVFSTMSIDFAMKIYRNHFNTIPPNVGTVKAILRAINRSFSSEYFVEIWKDLKELNFLKNRAVVRQVIFSVENCADESSLNIVHQAAINFLEKSEPEDILVEDKRTILCLLKAFIKNDDDKRLLAVLQNFERTFQLELDDLDWKIIFDYAINKKNIYLVRNLLTLASAAEYSNLACMVDKALPILNVDDADWALKLIGKKKV